MQVVYPPRPEGRILPDRLPAYEKTGKWVVQRKFNGTRNNVYVHGDTVKLFHKGRPHQQFTLTKGVREEILSLNFDRSKEYWLDSELLNAKTKNSAYKSKIVLYDVLQAGRYLFGAPDLLGRLAILDRICNHPQQKEPNLGIALRVTDNIWMAETFDQNFTDRFNDFIKNDEIEGVVLKRKDSVIKDYGKKEYEVSWQIRCRKPTKNYNF